ncbi:HotDog domain-containing protein [Ganoderma leucocontextum]|nr:HotDog domain-containing protein [Ganoderma leucocontextum]
MTSDTGDIVWTGDFTQDLKDQITRYSNLLIGAEGFAHSVTRRLKMKETAVFRRDKDEKTHCKVTLELTVDEDMVNLNGTMHGGCAVALIDVCSSMALTALAMYTGKPFNFVSQALNTTFHAPAPLGVKIEMVNTTVSFGARTVSAVTEIWDVTNGRLCMTGVHNKMAPSQPKL